MGKELEKIIVPIEASKLYGVSVRQIQRLCDSEKLIARKAGNTWLILKQSVDKYFKDKGKS